MPSRRNIRLARSLSLSRLARSLIYLVSDLHTTSPARLRPLLVACVRLVAIPQNVSGPRRPLREISRAESASCPHPAHVPWSCHALTRSLGPPPLLTLHVSSLKPSRRNISLVRSLSVSRL